jgi:hypothetical protein
MHLIYDFLLGLGKRRPSRNALGGPALFERKKISREHFWRMHLGLAIMWLVVLFIILVFIKKNQMGL